MSSTKERPLVFISHKHSDAELAKLVAQFIRTRSLGHVDVHLSSDWTFEGPPVGGNLNAELKKKLWATDALILVYTSSDENWDFCMWECGTATRADSPDTRVVVFQCGQDAPAPFASDLRVDVRKLDNIRKFTKELLTEDNFFPGRSALAKNIGAVGLEEAAQELFDKIKQKLPEILTDEWSAWPFLRVELPIDQVEKLRSASAPDGMAAAHEVIRGSAAVVAIANDTRAAQVFGLAQFQEKTMFKDLVKLWSDKHPNEEASWFESCCEQIVTGARGELTVIRRTPLREVGGDKKFTPVLSRVKRISQVSKKVVQFDIHFLNLSDPRAVRAEEVMIEMGKFFYINLGRQTPEAIKLGDLRNDLNRGGYNRIPFLDDQGVPLYIVHRSMLDRFVADNLWGKPGVSPENFTLADLLAEPWMKDIFENTFVVVGPRANLAEVKSAMVTRPGCLDAFVTEGGRRDAPVVGWLTNVDIDRCTS
jgi:hypothetical protein